MRHFVLFALVLGLVACRDGGGGDDTPTPDGSTNTDDVTIQEIQSDTMPPCDPANPASCVELKIKGVVVTAIDTFGGRTGDFWVQEPGGGPFSGVQVYGAPLDQIAALAIGDIVDIAGAQKAEFALSSDMSGNKLTELEPVGGGMMTVTKVSSGTPLEPAVVDALAIGQMTDFMARHAEWEKWEGVLVKVTNVQAFSDTECITSMGQCNDMTYERFDITGDVQVQSSLAAMPDPEVGSGDCLGGVTGVVGYFFDYQVLPRTTAEIATGGTACPTENQSAVCGDDIDNDGNGYKDCDDNSCITAESSCRMVMSIEDIQTATTPPAGGIELQDVLVAGISFNKRNNWVQSNLQAASNEGIYVRGPGSDLTTFAVGARVNLIGKVVEFNDTTGTDTLTQIQAISITTGTGTGGTVLPVLDQSAATLKMPAGGEAAESVLVEMRNVRVTTLGTSPNYLATLTQNGTTFKADDDIYRFGNDDMNDCFSTLIGFWSYNAFENDWVFLPRKAAASTAPDGVLAANQNDCN